MPMTVERLRADARACHAAALAGVEPSRLVAAHLRADGDRLVLGRPGDSAHAEHVGPVVVVGAGKAALAMARAAERVVSSCAAASAGATRPASGLVIVPHGSPDATELGLEVRSGAHPIPDGAGVGATARLLEVVGRAGKDTLVLVVLSGGASALLVAPSLGLTLADKRTLTEALLASGADIAAINTVRKHCSRVKGGGLARAAAGAAGLWTLVLSDVVGDDVATVASGPTVADPTTFADADAALRRHVPDGVVPHAVRSHLSRGMAGHLSETVKLGDPILDHGRTVLVGGNRDAVAAAAAEAASRGYVVDVVDEPLTGDAAAAGRLIAQRVVAAPADRPVAVIAGGETTVRVSPDGHGGRCQHLALAAALVIAGRDCVVLAAGTDGIDGGTDAAGGCVDGGTVGRARTQGLDAAWALAVTDSHPVLQASGDLLTTGATGTNVADLVVALRGTA